MLKDLCNIFDDGNDDDDIDRILNLSKNKQNFLDLIFIPLFPAHFMQWNQNTASYLETCVSFRFLQRFVYILIRKQMKDSCFWFTVSNTHE